MYFSFSNWIGQATTGHGVMIIGSTLLAASAGTMGWTTAVPFLVAGIIGLIWPENLALQSATQSVAADVETVVAAYRTGLSHGAAGDLPGAVAGGQLGVAAGMVVKPNYGATMRTVAVLTAAGLALTACANQTPAQRAATELTIASGLLCLADATGKVVATATTNDPNAIKGVNAAIAAGGELLTDTACQTAFASGAAVIPATVVVTP